MLVHEEYIFIFKKTGIDAEYLMYSDGIRLTLPLKTCDLTRCFFLLLFTDSHQEKPDPCSPEKKTWPLENYHTTFHVRKEERIHVTVLP